MRYARILGRCRHCWTKLLHVSYTTGQQAHICPNCDTEPQPGRRLYFPATMHPDDA